jgi:single-stranded-DNA-specific exonuclease
VTGPGPTRYRAGPPRWTLPPAIDADAASALAASLRLPAALARLLLARGVTTPDRARAHLRPLLEHLHPPDTLPDLVPALERLEAAVTRGETVLVHGDYDVDGVCAAALLSRWLARLGARPVAFAPHRLRDGYDLGAAGLRRAREVGATLLLTADCGVVAHEAVAEAGEAGIDVIVTDHHTPGPTLPRALAVVNPARADSAYPEATLCGAGVAFKVVQALATRRGVPFDDLLPDLDLVALATVADLVPLTGENRVLVRYGLRALHRTTKPGLRALLEVCGLEAAEPDAGQVGFRLAPRLNAVGRLGDAGEALRLLLTEDPDEARRLACAAEDTNRARQEEDRRTLEQALAQLDATFDAERDYGVVLAAQGWHPGVIGIVASRVVERIYRPVVLVALRDGTGRGSARSIPGFHLFEAIRACAQHLGRYGGHRQAAGMDLASAALEPFREAFNAEARRRLAGHELTPELTVDLELDLADADLPLADLFRYLGPHGIGNPRPVFLGRGVRVVGEPRAVGQGHLKLSLEAAGVTRPAIGFGLAERLPPEAVAGRRADAVFQLLPNEYKGRRTAQLRLIDLRPLDAPPAPLEASPR